MKFKGMNSARTFGLATEHEQDIGGNRYRLLSPQVDEKRYIYIKFVLSKGLRRDEYKGEMMGIPPQRGSSSAFCPTHAKKKTVKRRFVEMSAFRPITRAHIFFFFNFTIVNRDCVICSHLHFPGIARSSNAVFLYSPASALCSPCRSVEPVSPRQPPLADFLWAGRDEFESTALASRTLRKAALVQEFKNERGAKIGVWFSIHTFSGLLINFNLAMRQRQLPDQDVRLVSRD